MKTKTTWSLASRRGPVLAPERPRPAAVGADDLVDLAHEADGLVQGDDDAVAVGDVLCSGSNITWSHVERP